MPAAMYLTINYMLPVMHLAINFACYQLHIQQSTLYAISYVFNNQHWLFNIYTFWREPWTVVFIVLFLFKLLQRWDHKSNQCLHNIPKHKSEFTIDILHTRRYIKGFNGNFRGTTQINKAHKKSLLAMFYSQRK